jgi:hypothetical protein
MHTRMLVSHPNAQFCRRSLSGVADFPNGVNQEGFPSCAGGEPKKKVPAHSADTFNKTLGKVSTASRQGDSVHCSFGRGILLTCP